MSLPGARRGTARQTTAPAGTARWWCPSIRKLGQRVAGVFARSNRDLGERAKVRLARRFGWIGQALCSEGPDWLSTGTQGQLTNSLICLPKEAQIAPPPPSAGSGGPPIRTDALWVFNSIIGTSYNWSAPGTDTPARARSNFSRIAAAMFWQGMAGEITWGQHI